MTNPHQPMRYPTDAQPVRPGTSDALTARTIDATIHPPLVRAQETVTGLVPRVTQAVAPLVSPLFLSAVGLTLMFVWVARRMRYRPSALLLSGLLVMTLTSFHPVVARERSRVAQGSQVRIPRTVSRGSKAWYRYHDMLSRPADEPAPMVAVDEQPPMDVEPPAPPEPVEMPDMPPHPQISFAIPRLPIARIPQVSVEMVRSAGQMMRDNEQMQRLMRQLRSRIREEARRQQWRQMVAERKARVREFDLADSP